MRENMSGESGAERRRFPRKPMRLHLHFQVLDKDKVSAVQSNLAEDLGAGGLAMQTQAPLATGQVLMLTVHLPTAQVREAAESGRDYKMSEAMSINVLSRVAWCKPSGADAYLLGIQFLDLNRDDRQLLKDFLKQYRLLENEWLF